jgi:hypothetical protein
MNQNDRRRNTKYTNSLFSFHGIREICRLFSSRKLKFIRSCVSLFKIANYFEFFSFIRVRFRLSLRLEKQACGGKS